MRLSKTCIRLAFALLLANTGAAWGGDCQPKGTPPQASAAKLWNVWNAFDSSLCDSLISVLKRLANSPKFGGRELEKNKPLDQATAQKEVEQALADPKLKQELDRIGASEPDELRRLALEAALFDANLLFAARDLRIQEIAGKL